MVINLIEGKSYEYPIIVLQESRMPYAICTNLY